MIGRLPNRSDKTPSKGEKTNCISANTTANRALHFAASVISPPRKSRISFGKTGMIKPIARTSRVTVTRIKMTAAGRDFMRVEHQRNVVAAVVSTAEAMKSRAENFAQKNHATIVALVEFCLSLNSHRRGLATCG